MLESKNNPKKQAHRDKISLIFILPILTWLVWGLVSNAHIDDRDNYKPSKAELDKVAFDRACLEFKKFEKNFDCEKRMKFIRGRIIDPGDFIVYNYEFQDLMSESDPPYGFQVDLLQNGRMFLSNEDELKSLPIFKRAD